MIVWSGRGFLSVLVLIACFILFAKVLPDGQADYSFILSFFIAGAFSWFMGKKWNGQEGRTMLDKASGQEVIMKPNHTLFWIKMEYWGIVFVVFGLIILAQQFI